MRLTLFLLTLMRFVSLVQLEFKKTNIVFLKTHKCASSAIQNIFLRFGYFHELLFVLPPKHNYLGRYKPFKKSMVHKLRDGLEYNILAHHSRFNYTEMKKLMPNDTIFITILRDPVKQFESLYGYYNLKSYYGMGINKIADVPIEGWNFNVKPSQRAFGKFGFNQMLFDLGFDAMDKSVDQVDDYIDTLDKQFDLVMIADVMNESLVLLKSLLKWDYDDVAVFKVNARKKSHEVTEEVAEVIRSLNWADMRLYRFFRDKFEEQIRKYGTQKMNREKSALQKVLQDWTERCLETDPEEEDKDTCQLMLGKELQFTEILRKRQSNLLL